MILRLIRRTKTALPANCEAITQLRQARQREGQQHNRQRGRQNDRAFPVEAATVVVRLRPVSGGAPRGFPP